MRLFAFHCRDHAGSAALRAEALAAHLAHIEAHMDHYAVAGPLKEGDATVGSLLVIRAEDAAEAKARFAADPYVSAGVWESITCDEFRAVAGEWVGGAAWKRPAG
ncbi:YciI family protein [Erythrobacter sp. WG]|uniref:YciI family protein n=1 Tax=Erythrobacter sp. WG TaxID=2985510 RepID=UPI002271A732|nr:YciI family protein [Erythrobacter sp. WG]MCX9147983.1 YciI family protein [Erythrobacter sp. WG]